MAISLESNLEDIPSTRDCIYSPEGPRKCIVLYRDIDGLYDTCLVAQQMRVSSAIPLGLEGDITPLTPCPSNRLVRPCEYLVNKQVKIQ